MVANTVRPTAMTSATTTTTTTTTETTQAARGDAEEALPDTATLRLKKKKDKKVKWRTDTVDNEGLGRKSSKCCCVYRKPHDYDESSSDSEDEDCEHCRGHVEKKKT